MRQMAPALTGLAAAVFLLALAVLRWLRGRDTAKDVLAWVIVLIPLIAASIIAAHRR